MKALFITNKVSGRGKFYKNISDAEKLLKMKFDELETVIPDSVESFIKHVDNACIDNYDSIIFGGGDGTVNIVVSTVMKYEKKPKLGLIPLGTCNDVARNNNIPLNYKKAIECIINNKTKYHDVSSINDRYFTYASAIGIGSACTYKAKQQDKNRMGRLGYLGSILKEFLSKNVVKGKLIIDGKEEAVDSSLIYILNTKEIGSVKFNPRAKLNTGMVELVLINRGKHYGRLNIIRFMLRRLFGIKKVPAKTYTLNNFILDVDGDWNIDGEKGPSGRAEIKVFHNAIEFYTK